MKSELEKYLNNIKDEFKGYVIESSEVLLSLLIKQEKINIDLVKMHFNIEDFKSFGHKRIFDLTLEENWSVLTLILKLFKRGYTRHNLHLEKTWHLGHKEKGSLDILIHKDNKPFHLIEVKTQKEISKYVNTDEKNKNIHQLFSYIWQANQAKFASYYTYDVENKKDIFYTVLNVDEISRKAVDQEHFFEIWKKFWELKPLILQNNPFDEKIVPIIFDELESPDKNSTRKIFLQFLTILRINSVSDKSNAFDKIINIFISKVMDERIGDRHFNINNFEVLGTNFQYVHGIDDSVSLMKRLNDLYKEGMRQFLKKDIIDYSDDEINKLLEKENATLIAAFQNLRLKKNAAFSFIEVFDDESFEENARIVSEVVELLQKIKFEGNGHSQFLGDFFEELLNNTWKQEAGQFFTPLPMVKFIINSLPIKEKILMNIKATELEVLPKAIDYACGSGHFLIAYMHKVQEVIEEILHSEKLSNKYNAQFKSWVENPFSWASTSIFGIEKDYRLVKTTKIATFLNGDGEANIIHGDGINKFSSSEYSKTILYSENKMNPIFDFVIANPPYAVKGFEKNMMLNKITNEDFTLKQKISKGMIESLFIERTHQLLKPNGICAIVLPRSILSVEKYSDTRKFILENFKIISIFESGETSFSGTSTSPVIIFAKKCDVSSLKYGIVTISSPRFRYGSTNEEREWLGYQFSSNKHKLGIEELGNNLSSVISKELNAFFNNENEHTISYSKNLVYKKLSDIVVDENNSNRIYLNYTKPENGKSLRSWIDEFCPSDQFENVKNVNYIEIGNIENGKILKNFKTKVVSSKTAREGDILFPKLVGNPKKFKITLSDGDYYVSSAIAVLRIKDEKIRNKVFKYFQDNTNGVLDSMFCLGDGFKTTYLKISDINLLDNIFLDIK